MNTTIELCSVPDCNKKRHAKGFCNPHYQRFQRHGDPLKGRTPYGEPLKFLEDAIKQASPDACIIWPYALDKDGYGVLRKDGKNIGAHRLALILFTDISHDHLEAAHGPCHNPLCINPLHLRWATRKENNADRKRDGTHLAGERHPNSKLTEPEALKILQDQRIQREIAADYGVAQQQISRIKAGRRWAHLTENINQ